MKIEASLLEKLKGRRPLVCYDVETTGLSAVHDRIVQLSAIRVENGQMKSYDWYLKLPPNIHISPAAVATHHITEEFLEENGLNHLQVAKEFAEVIKGADLLSFNGNRFDIQFIDRLLKEVGVDVMAEERHYYDSFQMDVRMGPRDLSHTYERYTGKMMEGAHNSLCDVEATLEVFLHQLDYFGFEEIDNWPENQLLTVDGSIRNIAGPGEEPILVFTRGKYKEMEFCDVCRRDISYVQWFKDNVASPSTWRMLTKYYNKNK